MRGDANTKRRQAPARLRGRAYGGLPFLALFVFACGPLDSHQEGGENLPGRVAVSWTLEGATLTASTCESARIDSMNVYVASRADPNQVVDFRKVACALDRYSMAMVPLGPVRVFVDAVRNTPNVECVRYAGQADTTSTSQFPSQPQPVVLSFAANDP